MSSSIAMPGPRLNGPFMRKVRERERIEAQQRLTERRRSEQARQDEEVRKAIAEADFRHAQSEAKRRQLAEVAMYRMRHNRGAGVRTSAIIRAAGKDKLDSILTEVALAHGITERGMRSIRRFRKISYARQHFYYRAIMETMLSYPAVGEWIGRHHSTVMHGVRAHAERCGLPMPGEAI